MGRTREPFSHRYGPWALVTGASAGIGREFARQLARVGLNLVLVARRRQVLAMLTSELTADFPIQVRVVDCDLSRREGLAPLLALFGELDIGLLVNNAGAPSFHGHFVERDWAQIEDSLRFNTEIQMRLLHGAAVAMARRGRGGLIQVSSITGHTPVPYMAEYAADKAFQLALGESLHFELGERGVDVLVLSPGATRSERLDFGMEPDAVVAAALGGLGRVPSVIPGFGNRWRAFRFRHLDSRRRAIVRMGLFQRSRLRPRPGDPPPEPRDGESPAGG